MELNHRIQNVNFLNVQETRPKQRLTDHGASTAQGERIMCEPNVECLKHNCGWHTQPTCGPAINTNRQCLIFIIQYHTVTLTGVAHAIDLRADNNQKQTTDNVTRPLTTKDPSSEKKPHQNEFLQASISSATRAFEDMNYSRGNNSLSISR